MTEEEEMEVEWMVEVAQVGKGGGRWWRKNKKRRAVKMREVEVVEKEAVEGG